MLVRFVTDVFVASQNDPTVVFYGSQPDFVSDIMGKQTMVRDVRYLCQIEGVAEFFAPCAAINEQGGLYSDRFGCHKRGADFRRRAKRPDVDRI